MEKNYVCNICGSKYQTNSGLHKHKKKHENKQIEDDNKIKYKCNYCEKKCNSRQSKWAHEQKCKEIHQKPLTEKVKELIEENTILKLKNNNQHIVNNNTINNTNNTTNTTNYFMINNLGSESICHLTNEEQLKILNSGPNGLFKLIELINFNNSKPENHSYCVTSLNGTHASVIDNNTNKIIKKEKTEVFDKILTRSLGNLENLSNNPKVPGNIKTNGKDSLERIKKTVVFNKNGMKKYYNELNTISYNNKDMVLGTWDGLDKVQAIQNLQEQVQNNNQAIIDISDTESDFTESSDSDSDSDDGFTLKSHKYNKTKIDEEEQVDYIEITIGQKKYILEGTNVFVISNNKKGELYGTYSNGKVRRITNKDIQV
jgi:hypothetical protein